MKRNRRSDIILGFILLFFGQVYALSAFVIAPTDLTVECIHEPKGLKILDPKPEFSWIIPVQSKFQKGYQILVASSKRLIDENIGDIWDSGCVNSHQSVNVELEGKPLSPKTTYFWKVRYLDADDQLSNYSEVQEFTTGEFGDKLTTSNAFHVEQIPPVELIKRADGTYFADFGKDAFASLNLNYAVKEPATLTVRVGEKLLDGKIDSKPGGTIRYQEVTLKVTPDETAYQLSLVPDRRNTNHLAIALPDSFPVLMPFRYAEIMGATDLRKEDIRQEAYFYTFDEASSSFTSSDEILNQVWELCKYTQKATSFAGYYVDGDRERIPYEADAYLNQLSHYSVDKEYSIARKTIEYFFVSKPTWPTEWQMHVPMMVYQDYMYTGNTELIRKYYENLKIKTLMDLEVEDGFISTESENHNVELIKRLGFPDTTKRLKDIVDWPPAGKSFGGKQGVLKGERDGYVFKRINTVVNAFYYHNMLIMAQFAELLNKANDAADFAHRAARVKKSMNEQLYNEELGCYVDGVGTDHASLHANMLLVAFDAVPQVRLKPVLNYIKSRGMACSVYGAQYLMEALYKGGEAQYALDLLTATNDRSWYNMIKIGSTITLEAWDLKYKNNADYNHAWGAAPANIIPRGLWGIKPKVAGFEVVTIKPQMAELQHASLVIPTVRGAIKAEYWQTSNAVKVYAIELPGNMVGEFEIDLTSDSEILLNGEVEDNCFGSVPLSPGMNRIQITNKAL